jgi:hypothetical protein
VPFNVEKYCTARQATDDNITGRMRFACWVNKATDIIRNIQYLLLFHYNNGYATRLNITLYVHGPGPLGAVASKKNYFSNAAVLLITLALV